MAITANSCRKFFTLSFDDGTIYDLPFLEILNKYGIKCTFNLNSGLLGQRHNLLCDGEERCHDELTAEEVSRVYAGHEIAAHGLTHPNLCLLSREEIIQEVLEDRRKLQTLCGQEVSGFAYPGGWQDERVAAVIKEECGIRYARTVANHHNFTMPEDPMFWAGTCHQADEALFDLAKTFLEAKPKNDDLLFYVWGHSYEFAWDNTWERWEEFCRLISGAPDVEYVTNLKVIRYLDEKRDTERKGKATT